MVMNQMNYCMKGSVNCTSCIIYIAKILAQGLFLVVGNMDCVFYKLIYTLVFTCRNWNNRNAKQLFHFIYIY